MSVNARILEVREVEDGSVGSVTDRVDRQEMGGGKPLLTALREGFGEAIQESRVLRAFLATSAVALVGCMGDLDKRPVHDNRSGVLNPSGQSDRRGVDSDASFSKSPQQFGTIEGGLGLDDVKVPKLEIEPGWLVGVGEVAGRFEVDGKTGTIVVVYDPESEKDVLEYKLDGEETVYPVEIAGSSADIRAVACIDNMVYIILYDETAGILGGNIKFGKNNQLVLEDLKFAFEGDSVEMRLQRVGGVLYLYDGSSAVVRLNIETGKWETVFKGPGLLDQFTLGIPVQLVPGSDENPAGVWIVPKIDKESGITSFVITDYDPSEKDADDKYNVLSEQVVSAFNNISVDGIEHIASVDDVVKIQELSNGSVEVIFIAELFGPYKFGKYVVRAEISGLTKIVEQPEPQPEASDKDVGEYPDADAGSNVEVIELDSSDIEEVTGEDGDADAGGTGDGDDSGEDADNNEDTATPEGTSDNGEPNDEGPGDVGKPDDTGNPDDLGDLDDAEKTDDNGSDTGDGSDAADAGGPECSTAPENLPEHFSTTMNDCEIEVCKNGDGTFKVTMTGAPTDIEKCGINIGKTSVSAGNDATKSLDPAQSDGKITVSFAVSIKTGSSEQPVEAEIAGVQTGIDDIVKVMRSKTIGGSVQDGDYTFQAEDVNISLVDRGINEKGYRVVEVKAENMGIGSGGIMLIRGTRGNGFEIVVFVDGEWHPYVINEYGEFKEMPCSQADDPTCGSPDISPQKVDSSSGTDTVSGAEITGVPNGGEPGCSTSERARRKLPIVLMVAGILATIGASSRRRKATADNDASR